jgi:hypothetical protein
MTRFERWTVVTLLALLALAFLAATAAPRWSALAVPR